MKKYRKTIIILSIVIVVAIEQFIIIPVGISLGYPGIAKFVIGPLLVGITAGVLYTNGYRL